MSDRTDQVLSAPVKELYRASELLASHGIRCRFTRPKKSEGSLKVAPADATRARQLLENTFRGKIVSANEAAWSKCHACGASLSEGQKKCGRCNALVMDAHGG